MKALTLWQPWASLVAAGAKPYEFRGWLPPRGLVGQRIAIHAGARPIKRDEVRWLLLQLAPGVREAACLYPEIAAPILERVLAAPRLLPLSHVLCTAVLGEPKRGDLCAREFGAGGNDSERAGTFNWGWPLTAVERLEPPLPARGAQGFWEWQP